MRIAHQNNYKKSIKIIISDHIDKMSGNQKPSHHQSQSQSQSHNQPFQSHSYINRNRETTLLQTLVLFLQALGFHIKSYEELFNGEIIADFVTLIQGVQINREDVCRGGSEMGWRNYGIVGEKVGQVFVGFDVDMQQIYKYNNMDELLKLLKYLFLLSTRAPNYTYFIQKILTLPIQSQQLLAQLIRQDKYFRLSPSPSRQEQYEVQMQQKQKDKQIPKQQTHFKHKFSIIDKMYQMEMENQRLQNQIKRVMGENGELRDFVGSLTARVEELRAQCQQLRKQLTYATQSLASQSQQPQQAQHQQPNPQIDHVLKTYRDQFHLLSLQSQSAIKKYNQNIEYLNIQLQRQNNHKRSLKEQLDFCHRQFEQLIKRIQEHQKEIQELEAKIVEKDKELKAIRDREMSWKFQVGYRDSRIEELMGLLGFGDNSDVESVSSYAADNQLTAMRRSMMRSSKMLTSEFPHQNTSSTPNLLQSHISLDPNSSSMKTQLKYLRVQVQKINSYKQKIRELQYEKNRLLKILAEYENNRGEQNQILMGCLYQMWIGKGSATGGGKASVSRSTLADDGVDKDKNQAEC